MRLSRRSFLALGAASGAWLATRRAHAIGPGSAFRFGHIALGEHWNARPTALARMSREIEKRTSISEGRRYIASFAYDM